MKYQNAGATWHGDFSGDGWTPLDYEKSMRGAYKEQKSNGVDRPHVDYGVALQYYRHLKGRLIK